MDKAEIAAYQKIVQTLREAGIRAELYLGTSGKNWPQLEYADKRGVPARRYPGLERANANAPQVILKDLIEGAESCRLPSRTTRNGKRSRPAQVTVKRSRSGDGSSKDCSP